MNKQEISQRVLQGGKPLHESKFMWDESTKTFSSNEDNLVIDFNGIHYATIKCGYSATIDCGDYATIDCGESATIDCGDSATINCGRSATIKCGHYATIDCGSYATINCGSYATINCGEESVIIRRDVFEVITNPTTPIKICPYGIAGHLTQDESGKWMKDGEEHIIADGILSKVISHRGNLYEVINHGQSEESYLVTDGTNYAHGTTLKEAKESLIYKISDRDTSVYEGLTLDSVITFEDAVKMYRKITGACEGGVKGFVDTLSEVKESYSIKEIIELTKGRYNNELVVKFFNK